MPDLAGRTVRLIALFAIGLSVALALFAARRWPLVGDACLIHYVVFQIQHGLVPYRQILDINLPGTYAAEWLGMRLFGAGAVGWRIYDLFVLLLASAAMIRLGRHLHSWFGGFVAACLLALIHLQDGLFQVGQRDLLMAALLLWAYVALAGAQDSTSSGSSLFLFGLAIGATATIKPVLLPLGMVLLLTTAFVLRYKVAIRTSLAAGFLGMLVLPGLSALWLQQHQALEPFLTTTLGLLQLHSHLGSRPLAYLLSHSIAPLSLMLALWMVLLLFQRPDLTALQTLLYLGLPGTLLAYVAQGKGYPYQRYPLIALLLLLVCSSADKAVDSKGAIRYGGLAFFLLLSLVLAPRFAWVAMQFSRQTPFEDALGARLDQLSARSGSVQCLDTFGGCIGTLYRHGLLQSSGFLYDCYFFCATFRRTRRLPGTLPD